jgi:hypothetical protein
LEENGARDPRAERVRLHRDDEVARAELGVVYDVASDEATLQQMATLLEELATEAAS